MQKHIFKLINRTIDLFYKFDITGETERALQFDFLSKQEIKEYQQKAFKKLFDVAVVSPFYSKYKGIRSINELPLITRKEYTENYNNLLTGDKVYYERGSSGSTGNFAMFRITKEMLQTKRVSHQKMLKWYGLDRESSEMKIGGLPTSIKRKIYYYLRNKRYFCTNDFVGDKRTNVIKKYNKFQPEVLYGYPSLMNDMINFARSKGVYLHQPKLIVTHAENLYSDIRKNLSKAFPDSKIVNQYWATEANIAETCPEGNLHIDENTVIAELLNVNEEGVGDLYITNLFSFHLPLIRYKIGDRVKISDKACRCGRNTKIIESFEGRDIDYLVLNDGRAFPVTSIDISHYGENLHSFQFHYYKNQKKIIFKYMPINKELKINEEGLKNSFMSNYGISIEFNPVENIEYTSGGKFKKFIAFE